MSKKGLRVIAGEFGGRRLVVPDGARPTADRVREAVFSALGDTYVGANVLDLFAGSGALAIEALSRGGARAVMVDREPASMAAIRRNLIDLDLLRRARAVRKPVKTFLGGNPPREAPFGLVCADPPYDIDVGELRRLLEAVGAQHWVAPGAQLVLERPSQRRPTPDHGTFTVPEPWVSTWERTYGDTLVIIATRPDES